MNTIYNALGEKRFETPINIGSKRVFALMADDYITLKFSTDKAIYFALGDWCIIDDFGRFELSAPYKPQYNTETGGFDYELRLDAQYIKWRNKVMRYLPSAGGEECSWSLTATPQIHLEQVIENVNNLCDGEGGEAFLYNGSQKWMLGDMVGDFDVSAKTIQYEGISILEALNSIAETYECEWWITENRVNFGRCELLGDYIDFEIGKNVESMERSDSSEDYATRIIAFGSERNISPRYRKDLIFDVKEVDKTRNRISDTSRPLLTDWFDSSLVEIPTSMQARFSFSSTGNVHVSASEAKDVLLHRLERTSPTPKQGQWRVLLSQFTPGFAIESRSGSIYKTYARLTFEAIKDDGAQSVFLGAFDTETYIPAPQVETRAAFSNGTINIPADASHIKLTMEFYARFSSAGEVSITILRSDEPAICQYEYSVGRVNGLILDVIDAQGKVTKTIQNVVYNPDCSEIPSDSNWFQLPSGNSLAQGQRFFIRNILSNKVKSSYFSPRYSAYDSLNEILRQGVVDSRLMLPEGTPYVDLFPGQPLVEAVEKVVKFEDVYPCALLTVTSVEPVERKEAGQNDDSTESTKSFTAFRVKDDFFTASNPFSNDYRIGSEPLKITFQEGKKYQKGDKIPAGKNIGDLINPESGKLNGWTFEVEFSKDKDGSAVWEIQRDNTSFIPNEQLCPVEGDQFMLFGFDVAAVNELLVFKAEKELLEKAQKYVEKLNSDPSTYSCTLMSDDANSIGILPIGRRINLINPAYIKCAYDEFGRCWGRKSRVIGYELNLDIPYDSPLYTIGEKPAYSRLGAIEEKIDGFKLSSASATTAVKSSSGECSYAERTAFADRAYDLAPNSPVRTQFLSRINPDTATELIKFLKGIEVGNYIQGTAGGALGIDAIDGQSFVEVDRLWVRVKAFFEELEIAKVNTIGGKQIITPGGAVTISKVSTSMRGIYRCYFLSEQDGVACNCRFQVGDLAMCKTFNIAQSGIFRQAANRYYWREVVDVSLESFTDENGNKYGYVDLSRSLCDPSVENDIPAEGDVICQLGNTSDRDRQSAIILSTTDSDSPCIKLYSGINSFTLSSKEVMQFGHDRTNSEGFLLIGSTDSQHLRYSPSKGLEVRGKIAVEGDLKKYIDNADSELRNMLTDVRSTGSNLIRNSGLWYDETDGKAPESWRFINSANPNAYYLNGLLTLSKSNETSYGGITGTQPITIPINANVRLLLEGLVTGLADDLKGNDRGIIFGLVGLDAEGHWRDYLANQIGSDRAIIKNGAFRVSFVIKNDTTYTTFLPFIQLPNTSSPILQVKWVGAFLGTADTEWSPCPQDDYSYIKDGLTRDTLIAGGLVLSSHIAVRDASGKIWGGLNALDRSLGTQSPVLFAGDSIEEGHSPTFIIRRDGTGYACNGSVRFGENLMRIGTDVCLDAQGLRLLDGNDEVLRVTNASVGSIKDVAGIMEGALPENNNIIQYRFRKITAGEPNAIGLISTQDTYILSQAPTTTYSLISVASGETGQITLNVYLSVYTGANVLNSSVTGSIKIELLRDDICIATHNVKLTPNAKSFIAETSFSTGLSAGTWRCRISAPSTNDTSGREVTYNTTISTNGKFTKNGARGTLLGKDGFISKWGTATMATSCDGCVMICGSNGIMVDATGIKKLVNGSWVTANL